MKYITYCRKSSEDESHQVQSLETQRTILDEYSKRCGLEVVDSLEESRSAKIPNNRPLFSQMVDKIRNEDIDGILVAHIDRLSRNGYELFLLTQLFENGFLKEIRTPSTTFNSMQSLNYLENDLVKAQQYSRDLSVRVREGIQTKLNRGEYPNKAPVGYLNKDGKIYPDPDHTVYIQRIYGLYTSGEYSLKQLCNKLDSEGYRSTNGTKVRKSSIIHILKNPIYIGEILNKGKIYKGIHEPIISRELYDQAQSISLNKSRPKPKKYDFLYRGFVKCAECGCLFTTSKKVKPSLKQYIYYYCTNGKFVCSQHKKYLRDNKIQNLAQSIFDNLSGAMDSEIAQLSLESYYQSIKDEVGFEEQTKTNLDFQIKRNKGKQDTLLDLLLEEKVIQETYDTKLATLKTEEKELIKQQTNFKPQDPDVTLELLNNFKTEAISLKKIFFEGDDEVKKDLLNSALWNFSVKDGKVANVRYKVLYEKLSETAKSADFAQWRKGQDSNLRGFNTTRFPIVLLKPLGHPSKTSDSISGWGHFFFLFFCHSLTIFEAVFSISFSLFNSNFLEAVA